ncbi:hypothetical protein M413DRAFT_23562 [Hebeloma cylindrosporum]|uniref:Uncharacterized protein n=1 Tax=Hebeloma cylindrosporum TaxID=76867 RepID=A0A0C2Z291_HEBCY|nr:hypothetical protein M413DRAFT_23562 [Hebeloma cylindrosporum h7]
MDRSYPWRFADSPPPPYSGGTSLQYTAHELENIVLRNISSTVEWNSPRKPQERATPCAAGFPIGTKVSCSKVVDAYDLDSPDFALTIIYKDTSLDLREIYAQLDPSRSYLTFTIGLTFHDNHETVERFDVRILRIEQIGRGRRPEGKLVSSTDEISRLRGPLRHAGRLCDDDLSIL